MNAEQESSGILACELLRGHGIGASRRRLPCCRAAAITTAGNQYRRDFPLGADLYTLRRV